MESVNALSAGVRELYPWNGKHFDTGDGTKLHYLDEGSGDPILMVHGNPTWSFYYRNLIKEFSATHRCIVPDHVGMGLSDKPDGYVYSIRNHIANLSKLVEELDLRNVTLVVHDWGGPIGFGTALNSPERFKRFVVFNTSVFQGPMPPSIGMCRIPGLGPLIINGLNGFIRVGLIRAIADRERMAGAVGEGYLAPYDSWANRGAQKAFIDEIPMAESHPNWKLLSELDSGVSIFKDKPMVMIWGEQDFCFTPWYRQGMQERFPDAEVHPFDDAAHFVVEDAHERIIPLVHDFFARHPIDAGAASA